MIRFITENEAEEKLYFKDVEIHQFFISNDGELCQKYSSNSFCCIASADGVPYMSSSSCFLPNQYTVKKILPKVTKIEF